MIIEGKALSLTFPVTKSLCFLCQLQFSWNWNERPHFIWRLFCFRVEDELIKYCPYLLQNIVKTVHLQSTVVLGTAAWRYVSGPGRHFESPLCFPVSSDELELHEALRDASGSQCHQQQVQKMLCFWQVSNCSNCTVILCLQLGDPEWSL